MKIEIPEDLVAAAEISQQEAIQFLALSLYQNDRLTLGNASRLCNLAQSDFMDLMSAYGVTFNYDVEELEDDINTLRNLDLP